jgi:hypothetical protein
MALCSVCGAETELYSSGVPLCLKCVDGWEQQRAEDNKILARLRREEALARERSQQAFRNFQEITKDVPSGLPHPDGVERIRIAHSELTHANETYHAAHKRLLDFLLYRALPEHGEDPQA